MEHFLPIGFLFVFAVCLCIGIFAVTNLLGPKVTTAAKLSVYECGVKPEGNARTPFRTSFYMVAVLFLLFDVEAAFFFPWALVYKESLQEGGALLLAFGVYMTLFILGLVYIFRKDGLKLNIQR
jgi:NADH-quinone oxidoreductase subunit A